MISLNDKYTLQDGRIILNGTQALVRLLLLQKWRDQAAGHQTSALVSGYRGSPLAGLDMALWAAKKFLEPENILFKPGLNEELGATAIWGSQQTTLFENALYDGVFGMWYGKGPGVDRTGDVFKHANAAGTSKLGGVLALAGDDHLCKSSSLPHQSEFAFVDAMIPILNPSSIEDIFHFGLLGWAMSRFSGCWVALKLTGDTVDTTASIHVENIFFPIHLPVLNVSPPGGLNIRWPDPPLEQEKRLINFKLPAAQEFAYANNIDRILVSTPQDRCGIMTTGKTYLDLKQALADLNLDDQTLQKLGVRIYKVGLTWPMEPKRLKEFADGLQTILVVEEKRSFIETQAKEILFNEKAVRIFGKTNLDQTPLLPATYELDPSQVAQAILALFNHMGLPFPSTPTSTNVGSNDMAAIPANLKRLAYYCSGCPHNTSTQTSEGSRTLAGIGCHYMAMWIDHSTATFSQMGGEGASWIGQSPFTTTSHVFANMGDGTYFHSGVLAIRAAIAADVNITYKILLNDAVAMTGGQMVDGQLTASCLSQQLYAEGVKSIAVVTDEPDKYPIGTTFAPHTSIHHRRDLKSVEETFRQIAGVTAIVYDQTCAAEKRRRRKKGLMEDPSVRVFINDAVCEGCGDCGKKSNCLSIIPKETELGRKRSIEQSSCNKDFSCVEGFCPSFITVEGGTYQPKTQTFTQDMEIPDPVRPALANDTYNILMAGIGGTGVVTVGALLAMAAHIEGKGCSVLDMTGLSQKGGAVTSHIKIGLSPDHMSAARIAQRRTHAVLGADALVIGSQDVLPLIHQDQSKIVLNTAAIATGEFTKQADQQIPVDLIVQSLQKEGLDLHTFDFSRTCEQLLGNMLGVNIIILGFAYQKGLIPVHHDSLIEAMHLNKSGLEMNLKAFWIGRRMAFDPRWIHEVIKQNDPKPPLLKNLDDKIKFREEFLTNYQDAAYAQSYRSFINKVAETDAELGLGKKLTEAVCLYLFKLMAYKDEYEVARLYTQTDFLASVDLQIEGEHTVYFHLAPPLFASKDPSTGHLRKIKFKPWILKVFWLLAKFKYLRGTAFDIFGYTKERKVERQLIVDYKKLILDVMDKLKAHPSLLTYDHAVKIASFPDTIRGFGHVKEASIDQTLEALKKLEQSWPSA